MQHFVYVVIFSNPILEIKLVVILLLVRVSQIRRKKKIQTHVGGPNSAHNQASSKCQDLLNQNQHIETIFFKQSDQARIEYQTRLNSSVDCVKFLLRQRLVFRGHDESENSSNQGNFLELLKFLADHNEDVKVVTLSNAPQNLKLTSPDIQKGIVNVAAFETINVIIRDFGDALFSILIDEARDISIKEQMGVVIRYVDKKGQVIEHFLGIEHVANTNAPSLKQAMENLFSRLGLSISRLQGQGYDGTSNMQSEFNGLKTLILKENPYAYYVHCFAHQLQLALVAVPNNHNQIALLFTLVSNVVNVVGASCKRRDTVREKQATKVAEALNTGNLSSGQGLNQETNLKRAGDTRWGSHYGTLVSLASMFSTVIDVL
ncbi:zinc finger MYM-type protein 1-like [Camellia sinensis]|uniref:zinc finger MYM-type protein 1-like n=1 Tax=Camellia sinensis TaxID=4442 RepID=UPI001035787C|nr:zinc finger MYM-type protein 1-like [Camellia sinensis]